MHLQPIRTSYSLSSSVNLFDQVFEETQRRDRKKRLARLNRNGESMSGEPISADLLYLFFQDRQANFQNAPNFIHINSKILMDQNVSHSCNCFPRHFWVLFPNCFGHVFNSFSNNHKSLHNLILRTWRILKLPLRNSI